MNNSQPDIGGSAPIEIEVLYICDCPNHRPVVALLAEVVKELGKYARLRETEIRSVEDCAHPGFRGSPTVLVNDRDVEPDITASVSCAMSCRTYGGRRLPSRALIRAALLQAAAAPRPH